MTKTDLRRTLLLHAKVIQSFATLQRSVNCDNEMVLDTEALAEQSKQLAIELENYDLVLTAPNAEVVKVENQIELKRRSKAHDAIVKTVKFAKNQIKW